MADGGPRTPAEVRFGRLRDSLGFLLRLAQLRNFSSFFDDLGALGLRPGMVSVLIMVAENPGIRQGVLARALMIKRAHMTKMVQAMEDEGLIRRTVPEEDRRSVELWITQAGRARLDETRAPFDAFEKRASRRLSPAEERDLRRLLQRYLGLGPQGGGPT